MVHNNIEIFPQDVTAHPGDNAIFIVYGIKYNDQTIDKVNDVCSNFTGLIRSMRNRFPEDEFSAIIGFGSDAWDKLFPTKGKPKELTVFKEIKGERYTAVSTPGDIFFHIRCKKMGIIHEFASILDQKLQDVTYPIDEVHGFRFMHGKAIIGFTDGTENPAVDDNPYLSAIIGDEDKDFIGGSYIFVQKYIHDMRAWNMTSVEEQEKVIGRHKFNDVELSDDIKPSNAHNALTNIQDTDGNDLKIVRANMPFSNTSKGEYGTYFIGYAGKFSTTQKMLENMFIGDPVGNTDRLLDFSVPLTGTLFFAPSFDLLNNLGES